VRRFKMERKIENKLASRCTRIEDLPASGCELSEPAEEQLRLVEGGLRPTWTKLIIIGGPMYLGPMY
jgi:hypothetical protein